MVGYLYDESLEEVLLEFLLNYSEKFNIPFCAISINSAKDLLSGHKAEVIMGGLKKRIGVIETLPSILDCTFPVNLPLAARKYGADFISELRRKTHICIQKSVPKSRFADFLYMFNLFEHAIPTYEIKSYSELQKKISLFPKAVLKPSEGRMGARVYFLHRESDGSIFIEKDGKPEPFSEARLNAYLNDIKRAWMGVGLLQPYVDFRLDDNHALEFKLLRHRNENGEWKDVGTYAMIGGDPVVANISMGGSFADANECVQIIANKKADELYDKIDSLGFAVAKGIESLYGTDAYCLGIDIAVERKTLQPYVIEANTYPLAKRFAPAIAKQRLSYYKYLQKAYDV